MILEIVKDHKSGNRHYLKGKTYNVPKQMMQWKADELIKAKVAKYQKDIKLDKPIKKEVETI